jgi:hypothetical protein
LQILKRIVVILIGLLLFAFITVIFLLPDALSALAENIKTLSPVVRIIAAIFIDAILLGLVYTQVRPAPKHVETGLAVRASGAITDVSIESARERILKAVRAVPDVLSAAATLEGVRGKASVNLEVVVNGAQVNVPSKQKEIDRALKQVIEKQLGLQMASRPRVHIVLHEENSSSPSITATPSPAASPVPITTPAPPAHPLPETATVENKEASRPFGGLFGARKEEEIKDDDDTPATSPTPLYKPVWASEEHGDDKSEDSNVDEDINTESETTSSNNENKDDIKI